MSKDNEENRDSTDGEENASNTSAEFIQLKLVAVIFTLLAVTFVLHMIL